MLNKERIKKNEEGEGFMKNGMPVEVIDLTKILDGLENKWVVLSKDYKKVLAVAEELDQLGEKIGEGIVMKVPDPNYSYAPSSLIR